MLGKSSSPAAGGPRGHLDGASEADDLVLQHLALLHEQLESLAERMSEAWRGLANPWLLKRSSGKLCFSSGKQPVYYFVY